MYYVQKQKIEVYDLATNSVEAHPNVSNTYIIPTIDYDYTGLRYL